jgi:surface antigen
MRIQHPVLRRLAAVAIATGVFAAGVVATPALAAAVSVDGTVACEGGRAVVGVWVESSGGGSGFAGWQAQPGTPSIAHYRRVLDTARRTDISLDVGCGGSSAHWWGDNWTAGYRIGGSATLNALCWEDSGAGTRCDWPANGDVGSTNVFADGNCTYGAAEVWRYQTGAFPGWSGDAKYWSQNAARAGWTVVARPRARALVVMRPGATPSSYGHVAWVNSYRIAGGQVYLNITDMNRTALWRWDTYETRYLPGSMAFILAP